MTISVTDAASGPYYPNGVTVDFPFYFGVDGKSELRVVRIGSDGVEEDIPPSAYSILIAADSEGGKVTLAVAPVADGRALWILLNPSFEQDILFEDEGPFNSAVLNPMADRGARRSIWLRDRLARAFKLPFGEEAPQLPAAVFRRGGKIMGFNPSTGALELQSAGSFKGDPGGNTMAIGLFSIASTLTIPNGTDRVATSGFNSVGDGGEAFYVADVAVNAAYVVANPSTSFISANGRGFRISRDYVARGIGAKARRAADVLNERIRGKSFGAVGDGGPNPISARYATVAAAQADYPNVPVVALTDRVDGIAIQAALEEAKRLALPGINGGLLTGAVVELPEGRFTLSRSLRVPNGVQLRGAGIGRTIIDAQNFSVPGPLITNYSDANDSVDFFLEGLSLHGGTHGVKIDSGAGGQVNRLLMREVAMRLQTDKNFECNRLLQLADFVSCIFATAPYGLYAPAWTTNAVNLLMCGFEDHDWVPLTLRSAEAFNMLGGRFEAGGNKGYAYFTASIAGTTLTVTSQFAGVIRTGGILSGDAGGVAAGTSIRRQISGTVGGTGTYEVSIAQNVNSRQMTNSAVTIDCDRATVNDTGCQASFVGVYIENTARRLLRDVASKDGIGFDRCHFTQALDAGGFGVDYECFSDGVVHFGPNNFGPSGVVLPANAMVVGTNAKLKGNSNVYSSRTLGAVAFRSRRVSVVGSPTIRAVDFIRSASTGNCMTSGVLSVSVLGFDGSTGAVVHAFRRFGVNVYPVGGSLFVEKTNDLTTGGLAAATIDVQAAPGATALVAGVDIVVGNLNGSTPSSVWWSFVESGQADKPEETLRVTCGQGA